MPLITSGTLFTVLAYLLNKITESILKLFPGICAMPHIEDKTVLFAQTGVFEIILIAHPMTMMEKEISRPSRESLTGATG